VTVLATPLEEPNNMRVGFRANENRRLFVGLPEAGLPKHRCRLNELDPEQAGYCEYRPE
jgi:hypothetical protein